MNHSHLEGSVLISECDTLTGGASTSCATVFQTEGVQFFTCSQPSRSEALRLVTEVS